MRWIALLLLPAVLLLAAACEEEEEEVRSPQVPVATAPEITRAPRVVEPVFAPAAACDCYCYDCEVDRADAYCSECECWDWEERSGLARDCDCYDCEIHRPDVDCECECECGEW